MAQEITFTVGAVKQTRTLIMPGWYCEVCGDSFHTREDMKVSDAILDQMKRDQGL